MPNSNDATSEDNTSILKRLAHIPTPAIFAICIVVALMVLWWQGSLGELLGSLAQADRTLLIVTAPIYIASLYLLCIRWHLLVKMAQGWSDLPRASEAFLTSVVINYAAPVGLAVPSRAALTKRALGLNASATGTIALWEIGFDVLILGLGALLWIGIAEGSITQIRDTMAESADAYLLWGAIGIGIVLVIGAWIFRSERRRTKVLTLLRGILVAPFTRPKDASIAIGVTLVYWISQGLVLALLVRAMHVPVGFELVLGLTTLPILIGMLSPIPGGAVVREALMYVVARLAGVPGAEILAAAVIYRLALFGAIPVLYLLTRWWLARRGDTPLPIQHMTTEGKDAQAK